MLHHHGRAHRTAGARRFVPGGLALLDQARLHQLRWADRADRDHARRARRAPPVDQQRPVPPRVELLHAAARPGGAAARRIRRLAPAPRQRRDRRGPDVHHPGLLHHARTLLRLRRARGRRVGGRALLRPGRGGRRDRRRGGDQDRQEGATKRRPVPRGRAGVRRDLLPPRAVPVDRARRGADRTACRPPLGPTRSRSRRSTPTTEPVRRSRITARPVRTRT